MYTTTDELKQGRIVLVSRFPAHIDQPRGGVETATVGLARALLGIGITDIHVVTLERQCERVCHETHQGIQVHRLPRSGWPMMLDVFGGPSTRRLRQYLETLQPTIVHFHETWGLGGPNCGWPTIFTVHGFDSLNLPTEAPRGWRLRAKLWRRVERLGMAGQRHVISIAPYVRREVAPLTSAQIFEIWNSLDRRYFSLERREKPHNVLFLGWLNARKNPLTLVEAASQLVSRFPALQVELCGEACDTAYSASLKARIRALGLEQHVALPGRLDQSMVMARIQQASLLVLPSLQENAPMVIAEAMAAGVPVIASNRCGIPDMLEDGVSGVLIEPYDAGGLADVMAALLGDDEKRRQMGEAAKAEAFRRYHPDQVARSTLDAYACVINGSGQ